MKAIGREERIIKRCSAAFAATLFNLREYGARVTGQKILLKLAESAGFRKRMPYGKWLKTPLFTDEQLDAQRQRHFERDIKFSIICPLHDADSVYLRDMIDSVRAQTYKKWELCLVDGSDPARAGAHQICSGYAAKDERIRYRRLEAGRGAAYNANACIEMAGGEYLCLLGQDDILHPSVLHELMEVICETDAEFIYTDEAEFAGPDIKNVTMISFKPDYAPDDLRAFNYIGHAVAFSRALIDKCGAFREGYEGSPVYDFVLRLTSAAERIEHIPEVLYYSRAQNESTHQVRSKTEAGRKAVENSLEAAGISAKVEAADGGPLYRVSYRLPDTLPKVSIIIPNYNHREDLRCCLDSIKEKTTYPEYEVIIVENNSTDEALFEYYRELEADAGSNIRVITWRGEGFNWAQLNNFAVREAAEGDYLLLLNNDTEIITPDWIEQMLMHVQRPEVGIAGAMLYYPDDTIQHAGVLIGVNGVACHAFVSKRRGSPGYMNRLRYVRDVSAVTGACMLIRRSVFEELGGIDESYAVNYNDTDLCLRARKAGYLIVWTPFAELYHFESKSRGEAYTAKKMARLSREAGQFKARWAKELACGDPYYNRNLSHIKNYELSSRQGRHRRTADYLRKES